MSPQRRKSPAPPKPRRRLRAAFVADIENYSGRVSISESIAFRDSSTLLKGLKKDIEAHDGDIIGTPGDGMVALFESAVEAVRCALAVQARFGDGRLVGGMRLRIGIHLGEVIIEGLAPMGEAINVSARLQALAEPGSILVTEDVFNAVAAHVAARFEPLGVPQLRNIPRRFPIFRVVANSKTTEQVADAAPLDRTTRLPRRSALRETAHGKIAASPAAPPPCVNNLDLSTTRKTKLAKAREARPAEKNDPLETTSSSRSRLKTPTLAPAAAGLSTISSDIELGLVRLLTKHMGPLASVLLRRAASKASTAEELVARLEMEIPNEKERAQFRASASRLVSEG